MAAEWQRHDFIRSDNGTKIMVKLWIDKTELATKIIVGETIDILLGDSCCEAARSPASVAYGNQCCNCLRLETKSIALHLQQSSGKFMLRRMRLVGVSDVDNSCILCCDCRIYLECGQKSSRKNLWIHGWPAVIAYLLKYPKHSNIRNAVWKFHPSIHWESWRFLGASRGLNVEEPDCCAFVDFSERSNVRETYKVWSDSGFCKSHG